MINHRLNLWARVLELFDELPLSQFCMLSTSSLFSEPERAPPDKIRVRYVPFDALSIANARAGVITYPVLLVFPKLLSPGPGTPEWLAG